MYQFSWDFINFAFFSLMKSAGALILSVDVNSEGKGGAVYYNKMCI